MPTHTQHTLITWVPGSGDGMREARRLHARFRNYSVLKAPDRLSGSFMDDFMSVIVVVHRSEMTRKDVIESALRLFSQTQCSWIVLAICSGGQASRSGSLGSNELWSPAQYLANRLNKKVSSTTRTLTFDEVGQGLAFALTLGEVLIRSNYSGGGNLWVDYTRQSGLDEITEGLSNL